MPILKHAIKKMRVDKRRALVNKKIRTKVKAAVRKVRAQANAQTLKEVYSVLDRAVKTNVLPGGRVNRLKSRLSKLVVTEKVEKKVKAVKKAAKK